MADISALGAPQPVEPLDLANYADNQAAPPLPKKGRYTVQAPTSFPATSFGRSRAGALSAQIDPTIVAPSNDGYTIRFTKVSAKQFERRGIKVSQVGDYLRACGLRVKLGSEQEQADAIEQTAGLTYTVDLDWRAYNKNTGFAVEGMENFPSDGNGGYLPWIEDPSDKDEDGNPVRLRANVVVTRYIPA